MGQDRSVTAGRIVKLGKEYDDTCTASIKN